MLERLQPALFYLGGCCLVTGLALGFCDITVTDAEWLQWRWLFLGDGALIGIGLGLILLGWLMKD